MRRIIPIFVAAVSATLVAQTPVFRSSTTLVTVDVAVLDKDGRPVPGLAADDFQIKLNGKVQPVRAITYVSVAEKAAPLTARDIAPEVTGRHVITNDKPEGETRVIVLAVDDLSMPPLGGQGLLRAARAFVTDLPADVHLGLSTTSGTTVVNPTRDHDAVAAALAKVRGAFIDPRRPLVPGGPTVSIAEAIDIIDHNDYTALGRAVTRECPDQANTSVSSIRPETLGDSRCGQDTYSAARLIASQTRGTTSQQVMALQHLIEAMKGAPGLKQLVVVSQGVGSTREAQVTMNPLARAAAEAGVQVSVIMESGDTLDMSDVGNAADELGNVKPDTGLSNRRRDDRRMFRGALQTLADMSGGTFEEVIGQGDRAFERARVAGSAVYRIGVEPPADAPADKPFSVAASVTRPGVSVHANRQAVLPGPIAAPATSEQVDAAIREGQPLFSVPIRLAIARRRASSNQVELGIGMEVPASVAGPLTATFGLIDKDGALKQGSRAMPVPPKGSDYRLTFPMPVARGPYHVRFAVADANGSVGSIDTEVDATLVPLAGAEASDVLTWWVDTAGRAQFLALDTIPAGVTSLGAGVEIYPLAGQAFPENVRVTMSLTPANGGAAVISRDVAPLLGNNMWRAEAMLPLANVPAGAYVLKAAVTINGAAAGEVTAMVRNSG